jgi:molybdate/tungstate transport system substrate-binding protein
MKMIQKKSGAGLSRSRALRAAAICLLCLAAGCGERRPIRTLRVFHAAGFTPVIEEIRADAERDLGIRMLTESSGSQTVCRKVEELGRQADLLILADSRHVSELLRDSCSWRLDFAADEVALAIGARAPFADEAESAWMDVILRDGVRIGRVDENQAPLGYRALLVLKLEERRSGRAGLAEALNARSAVVADDASRLAPLLKSGELDYAFLYRSICIAMDIRFIELPPEINLGRVDLDYSGASVTYELLGAGEKRMVTVHGAPAVWALTVPDTGADLETALSFIGYLLKERGLLLTLNGFEPLAAPVFHGPAESFEPFKEWAVRAGSLR